VQDIYNITAFRECVPVKPCAVQVYGQLSSMLPAICNRSAKSQNTVIVGKTALPFGPVAVVLWGNKLQHPETTGVIWSEEECYSVELFPTFRRVHEQCRGVRAVFSEI
jgi:hypothetical protein